MMFKPMFATVNVFHDRYEITALVPLDDRELKQRIRAVTDNEHVAHFAWIRHTDDWGSPTFEVTYIVTFSRLLSDSEKVILQAVFGHAPELEARAAERRQQASRILLDGRTLH